MAPSRSLRRPARAGAALLSGAVGVLLAACGQGGGGSPGAGTLVAALDAEPAHLNPAITTGGGIHTASELLYHGLVELDDSLRPVPGLAGRWEVEDGGRRYRFHLRPDVVWHDGAPFTSADVVWTFRHALLRYHARTRASLGSALDSLTAPDPRTVVFHFGAPYAPLLQQLHVHEAPILPRHMYEGTDPLTNPHNLEPVGTGPFRFDGSVPGTEIRLRANPDYFVEGLPRLERVVLRIVPDPGTRLLALEAGEVQWLWDAPGPDRERLRGDPDVRLLEATALSGGANCVMTVGLNLERPVLRDVRVRRALSHAIDRERIVERVLFGAGRPATRPISSAIDWVRSGELPVPGHDPRAAARLLDEAGWRADGAGPVRVARGVPGVPDGAPLRLGFTHFPGMAAYAQLLRAELREVGVDLVLEAREPAVAVEKVFTARDFDTVLVSYCNGTDPEIGVRRMYVSSNIAPVPFSNAAAYRDATVDSLFDRARTTLDPAERAHLYARLQDRVIRDMPYVWLVETVAVRAHAARCHDFRAVGHFAERAWCEG